MKKKTVNEIKFGERVLSLLQSPTAFNEVVSKSSLDRLATQKVLASLQKHGYISKDEKNLWVAVGAPGNA